MLDRINNDNSFESLYNYSSNHVTTETIIRLRLSSGSHHWSLSCYQMSNSICLINTSQTILMQKLLYLLFFSQKANIKHFYCWWQFSPTIQPYYVLIVSENYRFRTNKAITQRQPYGLLYSEVRETYLMRVDFVIYSLIDTKAHYL